MKTSGMDIHNHKKRGHWAELRFMAKAAELGFQLSTPLGETAQYDVVIDLGGRFISVQVKSTYFEAGSFSSFRAIFGRQPCPRQAGPNHRYASKPILGLPRPFTVFLKISGTSSRGLLPGANSPSASARATNKTSGSTTEKPGICSTTVPRRHC